MNNEQKWADIVNYYKEQFDIEAELVEIMADLDIVLLSATGASNTAISKILNLTPDEVSLALNRICEGFTGWEESLDFNPYLIFLDSVRVNPDDSQPTKDDIYKLYMSSIPTNIDFGTSEMSFEVCTICNLLENRLAQEWK